MAKSYFAILGVASSASPDEIRSAYRRLAKEFHPDHFTGGSGTFQQIQEAYSVLGDAHKRSENVPVVPARAPYPEKCPLPYRFPQGFGVTMPW